MVDLEIGDRRAEGIVLGNLGNTYLDLGDPGRAVSYFEQCLAVASAMGDRQGEGVALGSLGSAYLALGSFGRAIESYEQRLSIAREIGDRLGESTVLGNLGEAYRQLGDSSRAIPYLKQHLSIDQEIGNRRGEANALGGLGNAYADLGDSWQAILCYEQALDIDREIRDLNGLAHDSFNLAVLHTQRGDRGRALPLAREAARLFAQMGHVANAQQAQQLVAQLEAGIHPIAGPNPAEILSRFMPVIEATVAAARGNRTAKAQLEQAFPMLTQNRWQIAEPIRRIWAGERDAAKLTAGIDSNSALIVRGILRRL